MGKNIDGMLLFVVLCLNVDYEIDKFLVWLIVQKSLVNSLCWKCKNDIIHSMTNSAHIIYLFHTYICVFYTSLFTHTHNFSDAKLVM